MFSTLSRLATKVFTYFDPNMEDYEKQLHALKRGDTFKSKMDRMARRVCGDRF